MTALVPGFKYYKLPDGAELRYAVFEPRGEPNGTFLIVQGRREFIEKKVLEVGRDLMKRGYKIILFDSRGQGYSSRFLGGVARQYDHLENFDVYVEDMRAFYRDIVKPNQSGPLFIFAHSMGGLITARWLAETPEDRADIKAMIMTAPAFAIGVPPLSFSISRLLTALGRGAHYAGGQHGYDDRDRRFAHNMLSHDPKRFSVIEKFFDANPDLKVGGVTWGWLAAALKAMKKLRKPGYVARIDTPVLALFGTRDIVTPPAKIIPLIRQMPNAEIFTIRGAWHDLMNEADLYRDQAWRHIDLFLQEIMA